MSEEPLWELKLNKPFFLFYAFLGLGAVSVMFILLFEFDLPDHLFYVFSGLAVFMAWALLHLLIKQIRMGWNKALYSFYSDRLVIHYAGVELGKEDFLGFRYQKEGIRILTQEYKDASFLEKQHYNDKNFYLFINTLYLSISKKNRFRAFLKEWIGQDRVWDLKFGEF